jgi:hypothetical protein
MAGIPLLLRKAIIFFAASSTLGLKRRLQKMKGTDDESGLVGRFILVCPHSRENSIKVLPPRHFELIVGEQQQCGGVV